ncbi:MAG: pyruvate:ferredoxin (flavodoxin) oxidoreductase [Gammaproteobacteria bacterium]|nr:pyruvate:ferredoxin (flavodoxin) oxidoreductase [Gammaproteobacteria bacterium]
MSKPNMVTVDGIEAAAHVAHKTNEVIAIYPITPSSGMGELSDEYSAKGRTNLWGTIPQVIEMQHEGGAIATVHGSLQTGSLTTTFTSSQGLLLMIPSMYKIAGELTPSVIHVAARAIAAQGLSIFGDHSDIMSTRATGYAMLGSNNPQEVMDAALISQAATLESRIPFIHFFDGFRTSHEVSKADLIKDDVMNAMIPGDLVRAHRDRAMNPDKPVVRGTSQNPDVYFQGRETVNTYYNETPAIVQKAMDKLAGLTGRQYHLFDYYGAKDAEQVIVLMGSAADTVKETVQKMMAAGDKVGMLIVRLYRPFSPEHMIAALPASTQKIAVLDRCKEPGSDGEPLYKDMITALATHVATGGEKFSSMPRVVGGRYGLSSKEFTPGMVKGIFDNLDLDSPKNDFTVGIIDDVTHSNLDWDDSYTTIDAEKVTQCMFYGLGADGTVSANKNSIKIIGEGTDLFGQGYFVYDSKKAGAVTVSHLRFGPDQINSSYLIGKSQADFVACHQPVFLEKYDMLDYARDGGVFLVNSPAPADKVWQTIPRKLQQQIIDKKLSVYTIDAYKVAAEAGMGRRINTVMQTCFFAISGILLKDEAIAKIKDAAEKTYGKKGPAVVEQNFKAIDASIANMHQVDIPDSANSTVEQVPPVTANAPEFIQKVTGEIIAGRGDSIPVSMMPADGTWPLDSSSYEKRNLAREIPVWDAELCIYCGKCVFVCPHSAIRSKVFDVAITENAPETFKHIQVKGKEFAEGEHITYQVAPEDCTGCTLCVDICPAVDKQNPEHKALDMEDQPPLRDAERENWDYFLTIPEYDRNKIAWGTMKTAMLAQPLFESSGACVGCGETPYVRLATQLFGDRMVIGNATGCSSIYGGNLPTTPYATNNEGRGPAWNNSLFEDTAEFSLGFRVSIDTQADYARVLLGDLRGEIGSELVDSILDADQSTEPGIFQQRDRIDEAKDKLRGVDSEDARNLEAVIGNLAQKSVWAFGGDGWAYDIGYGGLDHVLASGKNVNILVLDTEVYSNTGGQMSKSTPKGAIAKFAAGGKPSRKKDLAMIAMAYGDVYVAQVAYSAKDVRTLKAFQEAESYDGISIIIAYSPCIAQGIDLTTSNHQSQDMAVKSGHFPLFRYDPRLAMKGKNPLQLDSKEPTIALADFMKTETRFSHLSRIDPEAAERLSAEAQADVKTKFSYYKQLASLAVEHNSEN